MSETPKFTPGTWEVEAHDNGCVFVTSDELIGNGDIADLYHIWMGDGGGEDNKIVTKENALANAHLIAAAPELYGEGRASARTMEDVADALGERGLLDLADELRGRARSVREVLLKAEGRK